MPDTLEVIVDHAVDATPSIRILHARPKDPSHSLPAYQAGQYAYIKLPGFEPRAFSIASAPHESSLQFHIRNAGHGASAYAMENLHKGSIIDLQMPFGTCTYDPAQKNIDDGITVIVGGAGLSQARSIVFTALHHYPDRPVTLYIGHKTRADSYLHGLFTTWQADHKYFQYHPVLSDEVVESFSHGLVGDIAAKDLALVDQNKSPIYIAGPPAMVTATADALMHIGIDRKRLYSDMLPHPEGPG